jgi:hypothetical protein
MGILGTNATHDERTLEPERLYLPTTLVAKAAIVVDTTNGHVLYGQRSGEPQPLGFQRSLVMRRIRAEDTHLRWHHPVRCRTRLTYIPVDTAPPPYIPARMHIHHHTYQTYGQNARHPGHHYILFPTRIHRIILT